MRRDIREEGAAPQRSTGLLVILFAAGALPVLLAIWCVPDFHPQDAPPHVYSSEMMLRVLTGDEWASSFFEVRSHPVPNTLAHALLAVLMIVFSPATAERLMMSGTFVGLAAAITALRIIVRPGNGLGAIIPIALLLSVGRLWILGFWGFLIGCIISCLTIALWWSGRERGRVATLAVLASLLIVGFFAHLVSYLATLLVIAVLVVVPHRGRAHLAGASLLAASPSLGLLGWYAMIMGTHGSFAPEYLRLHEWTLPQVLQYLRTIKLVSIASQNSLPFVSNEMPLFALAAPAVLLALSFLILARRPIRRVKMAIKKRSPLLGFAAASVVLLGFALVAPDTFGSQHGGFLRERLFLIGLICALAILSTRSRWGKAAGGLALAGLVVQAGFVWEYALWSRTVAAPMRIASEYLPEGSRVYVHQEPVSKGKFRASPHLHISSISGFGRRIVVWNNYEAYLYYFPLNLREPYRAAPTLDAHRDRTDILIVRGDAPPGITDGFHRAVDVPPDVAVYVRAVDAAAPPEDTVVPSEATVLQTPVE